MFLLALADPFVQVQFRNSGEEADRFVGILHQAIMIVQLKIELQQLKVDRKFILFPFQRKPELFTGLLELSIAQQEIAVDRVRLPALRMSDLQ